MNKKQIIWGVMILVIICLIIGCKFFFDWINEPLYPTLPEQSVRDKIILTSQGYCFWAEDMTIVLVDTSGNEYSMISTDIVYEYDIFECTNIPNIETLIQVIMNFRSHYAIEEDVSLLVAEYSNTDELLKNGLLLSFGDGDLMVRSGENDTYFYAGVFGDDGQESSWFPLAFVKGSNDFFRKKAEPILLNSANWKYAIIWLRFIKLKSERRFARKSDNCFTKS